MQIKYLIYPHTKYLNPAIFSQKEIQYGEGNDLLLVQLTNMPDIEFIYASNDVCKDDCYNYLLNFHHLKTDWQYKHIIPALQLLLKDLFPFSFEDFILSGKVNSLLPKEKQEFEICAYDTILHEKKSTNFTDRFLDIYKLKKHNFILSSDDVFNCNECHNSNMYQECFSVYHKIFKFSHQTCVMKNITKNFNGIDKTLLISSDSMFIPIIPIITKYYKTVIIADNRTNVDLLKFLNIDPLIADIMLFVIYPDNNINKYFVNNLHSDRKYFSYKCII